MKCLSRISLQEFCRGMLIPSRRIQKISLLDGYDPLLGVPAKANAVVPPVDASDLVSYLVLETSFITAKQFKARKGLEAYNQFVAG